MAGLGQGKSREGQGNGFKRGSKMNGWCTSSDTICLMQVKYLSPALDCNESISLSVFQCYIVLYCCISMLYCIVLLYFTILEPLNAIRRLQPGNKEEMRGSRLPASHTEILACTKAISLHITLSIQFSQWIRQILANKIITFAKLKKLKKRFIKHIHTPKTYLQLSS